MPQNSACTNCKLHLNARSVCTWGRQVGSTGPEPIMVIGEAPGFHEDQQGSPFVGPSGKLLTEALEKVGIQDYYVTNVVKCFPDGTPSSTEISACKGYLDEEIRTVRPRCILALGNSAWHFFGRGPISEHAGRESRSPQYDCWVMPVLHPAAILRNPNQERAWRADLYRFARLVRGELIEKPPVATRLVLDRRTLEILLDILEVTPFTYDFETPVLSWADKTWKPLTIAFGFHNVMGKLQGWTVPLAYPNSGINREALKWFLDEMIPVMSDPAKSKTAHNAIFDDLCWYRLTGQLPYVTCDTMVLAHLLDENRQKGLKYLGRSLLGWPQWDIDAKKEHPLEQLAEYNAYDAAATLLLREKLLAELKEQPRLWDYFTKLEMGKIRALERLIARGIYVDRERLEERCLSATVARAAVLRDLPIKNPASTPQLKTWLYTDLKLTPPHLTPKGAPSTDEESILRLCQRYPEHQGIRKLLEWRKWNKFLTTYLTPSGNSLENSFDGRIHPEYRSTSVETGRLGSSFHTTPRDNFIRSIYTAPPGMSLISADYCLHPETLVETIDGVRQIQTITVGDKVFTERDGRIAWGTVVRTTPIPCLPAYRITFDNGEQVTASSDHRWPIRKQRGKTKGWAGESRIVLRTDELQVGDRLIPMRRQVNPKNGYVQMYSKSAFSYEKEHLLVADAVYGSRPEGYDVHHKNHTRTDNHPGNLEYRQEFDHLSEHGKENYARQDHTLRLERLRDGIKARRSYVGAGNPRYGKRSIPSYTCLRCDKSFWKNTGTINPSKFCGNDCYRAARRDGLNHKVTNIEYVGLQPMWAIEVDPDHNYILAAGVVTHNSQIEARLAAWAAAGKPQQVVTASPTMLVAWFTGRDVYREQAAAILQKPVRQITSDERQMLGKVPVLSMLYAISPKGLQEYVWREYEIDWTRAQAQKCWDGFYALWPEFRRWHELMRIKIETDGEVVSEIGRVRRLPAALYGDWRAKDEAVRSGINAPIQSLASDILQTAAIILDQQGYAVVGSIHDAVLIEEPDLSRVEQIRQVMEAAHLALRPLGLRLPHGLIRVEIKAGGGWGEGKEIPVQVKRLDLVPTALVP